MKLIARRQFIFNWKVSVFAALCLMAFVNLGFWQLDREKEKTGFIAQQNERSRQTPLMTPDIPSSGDVSGLPVVLKGRFDPEVVFLLDNRVLDGRVGFEIVQLFRDQSDLLFLVNRGFVQMGRTRNDPVQIPTLQSADLQIKGQIYQGPGTNSMVHNGDITNLPYPVIVQHIDIVQFEKRLGLTLYPHVIRLDQGQPGALPRYWPSTVMKPEQHRGYAIQWFTMALAVTLAWFFFSFRRADKQEEIEEIDE